jgi:hypothetical protein
LAAKRFKLRSVFLGLLGGGEVAEAVFNRSDGGFQLGDRLFGVAEAIFELLQLDGVQALDVGRGNGFGGWGWNFRDGDGCGRWSQGVCNLFGYFFGATLFAPEVVLVVAGVDVEAARRTSLARRSRWLVGSSRRRKLLGETSILAIA